MSMIYIITKQNSVGIYCQINEKLGLKTWNTSRVAQRDKIDNADIILNICKTQQAILSP